MPSFTKELDLAVSAPRLWATMQHTSDLFPKIAPQMFASITHVEGSASEGTVGSQRIIKFGPVAPEGAFVKEKLAALDEANMSITAEEIEGGHLHMGFTKWTQSFSIIAVDDKSCKVKTVVEYEGGDETHIEEAKEGFSKLAQGVVAYLQASSA